MITINTGIAKVPDGEGGFAPIPAIAAPQIDDATASADHPWSGQKVAVELATKQPTISDLETIRSGAESGATALQEVPNTYRTAAAQDAIDAGKQDTIDAEHKLSYSLLSGTPTIPEAVTEQTVSGWGFTKNTGTYSKPDGGIPKTDLDSAVQTSLGKADSALQSIPTASQITITDTGSYYATDNVNAALQQIGATLDGLESLLAAL